MSGVEFNWFPGHMNKTLKEIENRIPIVDLVIEIIDARAPFSSQNQTFAKVLKHRPVLYVLSKTDIADPEVTKKWLLYFEKQGRPTFVVDYKEKKIVSKFISLIDQITQAKQNRDKKRGIVVPIINALVIGIPNVGKSNFINHLIKDKSVKVGNKPGLTRGIQLLHLNDRINLVDTPGVLPPKMKSKIMAANLCGIRSIKENVFPYEWVSELLMKYIFNHYPNLIEKHYKITTQLKRPISEEDAYFIFEEIAKSKKWDVNYGVLAIEKIMQQFLHDLADGKLKVSLEMPSEVKDLGEE